MSSLLTKDSIQVIQPNLKGDYINGRFVPGETKILDNIKVSVQPLKGSEIKMLPEGRRNDEAIKVYTKLKMFISDEKNNKKASQILYDGKNYEVHKVFNFNIKTRIKHFKVIAIKIDGEGEGTNV